jgi:hypothetical protein
MPRMKKLLICVAILAVAFSTACSRARVTTELHSDGSFTRSIVLAGQAKQEGSMMETPTLEDTFVFPAGPGWKMTDGDSSHPMPRVSAVSVNAGTQPGGAKQSEIIKTFTRTFPAGSPVKGDFAIREGKPSNALQLVNEATVTKVGANRYEYKETLRWTGTPPDPPDFKAEDLAEIKARLPKVLATDENARGVALHTYRQIMPMMFGPSDPLLATGWLHPELAERRIVQKAGGAMMKALEEQFGDKLTVDERRELVRQVIAKSLNSTKPSQPAMGGGDSKKSSSAGLTPLTFVLRSPGRLISTNGEYDEFSGEVYWAFYPEAASLQPVVLTAVYELPK